MMATVGGSEDFTICSICDQTFTSPKYLPCLHTFCEHCLQEWLESQLEKGHCGPIPEFLCPICRAETRLPSKATTSTRSEWASTFPSNIMIISLINKTRVKGQNKSCDFCNEMKKDQPATMWCVQCSEAYCDDCTEVHRVMKATRKHRLIGLEEVISDLKCIAIDEVCYEHIEEVLTLFCVDHNQACCTVCAVTLHRNCRKVLDLTHEAGDVRNKTDFTALLKTLNGVEKDIQNRSKTIQEQLSLLNNKKLEIERSAKDLVDTRIAHIKTLYDVFLKKLSDEHSQLVNPLEIAKKKCILQQQLIGNSKSVLEESWQNHAADKELFLQVKKAEAMCKRSKTVISNEMPTMTHPELNSSFSNAIKGIEDINSFGGVNAFTNKCRHCVKKLKWSMDCGCFDVTKEYMRRELELDTQLRGRARRY